VAEGVMPTFSSTALVFSVAAGNSFVQMGHGDLALAAYRADPLKGKEDLYSFLGVEYVHHSE
jgi:hypothetical protein